MQVAIVIGGGNIYRGMNEAETGIERAQGDYMGCLQQLSMEWLCKADLKE